MAVDDHGLEVLKKSGEEVVPGSKADYYIKVGGLPDSSSGEIHPITIVDADTTVTIFNVTITSANTEQSQALPANTKEFLIRTRGSAELKLAYDSGDSGTLFVTIPGRATKTVSRFFKAQTLYFQSPTAGEIVEIEAYT